MTDNSDTKIFVTKLCDEEAQKNNLIVVWVTTTQPHLKFKLSHPTPETCK